VELEENKQPKLKHIDYKTMKRTIGILFLSIALTTALLADQNGLTSDILDRADSLKADSAAFETSISSRDGLLQATAVNETASLLANQGATEKVSSAETRITNEPSSLNRSPSSTSNAETRITNSPSSLNTSPSSTSNAETRTTNAPSSLNASLSSTSNAETRNTNAPSSLNTSLSSTSNAETRNTNAPSSLESSQSSGTNASP
jgi:hypothetical protein